MINYTLTRSKRKTIGIYISRGTVEVRAPLKYPQSEIDSFVISKQKWIQDKLAIFQKRAEDKKTFTITYGSKIPFRGAMYPIVAREGGEAWFDGTYFYVPKKLDDFQIKKACIETYRIIAKLHIVSRIIAFVPYIGDAPNAVNINNAKTRWGSCSSKKNLNFSWRLIMGDDDIIDYVVVHELAHLLHMNHSAAFWSIVESVLPDYRQRQIKLKDLHHRLSAEDWDL